MGSPMPGTYTVSDTTVKVGDVVEFVNSYGTSTFTVDNDGVVTNVPTVSTGNVIYSYTFTSGDLGNIDIDVTSGPMYTLLLLTQQLLELKMCQM